MATTLINRVVSQLKLAYEMKGWTVRILHDDVEENRAHTTIKLFMPNQFNLYSHKFNFYTKNEVLVKIRIDGDYNTVVKEAKSIERSNQIFSLPVRKIDFYQEMYTTATADFHLADYSHLLK